VIGAILALWDALGFVDRLVIRDSWDLRAILDTLGPRVTREMSVYAVHVEMLVWLANKVRLGGTVSEGRLVLAAGAAWKETLVPRESRVQ